MTFEAHEWRHGGKMDAIAKDHSTGELLLVEHKVSSEDIEAGSSYWRRLRLDTQVSKYFVGARALGYDVAKCLYDVLRRPAQRPLEATPEAARKYTKATKNQPSRLYAGQRDRGETVDEYRGRVMEDIAERPDFYYRRGIVVRHAADIREWATDTWKMAEQVRLGEADGHYPKNPDACGLYHRDCEYLPVCSGEATIDDPALYRRAAGAHEELAEEEKVDG